MTFNLVLWPSWWWRKCLVDVNAGKTQFVSYDRSNNKGVIDMKMNGSGLEEKSSFTIPGLIFSFKLDRGSYIISFAKTASKKIGALICSMKFRSTEVFLYLYKFTIRSCIKLELWDKLQNRICGTVGPSLAAFHELLAHYRNVGSLRLFYRYYFGRFFSELAQLASLPYSWGRSTRYSDWFFCHHF